jgi:ankyrin repeat protein
LHWAAFAGQAEIVELLLTANATVNATERSYGGTPLGWAVYGWNNPAPEFRNAGHHEAVERLIRAGAVVDWGWIDSPNRGGSLGAKLRKDSRMMAALGVGK